MVQETKKYRQRKLRPIILTTLTVLFLIPVCICVTLFLVNRFALVVDVFGEQQMQLSWGDPYEDAGAGARLVGTLFFKEGIQLDTPVTAEGIVHASTPGTYTVTYRASFYGWSGSAVRTVQVRDSESPVITLVSDPNG